MTPRPPRRPAPEAVQHRAVYQLKAEFFRILGHPVRVRILELLKDGERSVGELEEIVSLSQSALSQHLARLRRSHLVKTRRESQTIYYSIADPGVAKVIGALYDLYCGPNSGRESESKRK